MGDEVTQQGFDGFPDTTANDGNDQTTTSPQYIVHNHVPDAPIEVVDDGSRSKKRKKKKKKKYKSSKGCNAGGIALMPMSTNDVAVPTAGDNANGSGEQQMESKKKKKKKSKK